MQIIGWPFALYNEIDEYAAEWLENLIRLGVIAPGIVDRRSIEDLRGDDLRQFRQCHFFAGIGVWSYALRCAGVPDDAPLWTGSCPCQPFSAAGKGTGVDDERHLWPAWQHLIRQERPPRIYGEQVASKDGLGWLDLVLADMEAEDYSIWAVDTCSAGSGAPHIRQRLRFCADDLRFATGGLEHTRLHRPQGRLLGRQDTERRTLDRSSRRDGAVDRLASGDHDERWSDLSLGRQEGRTPDGRGGAVVRLADMQRIRHEGILRESGERLDRGGYEERSQPRSESGITSGGMGESHSGLSGRRSTEASGPQTASGRLEEPYHHRPFHAGSRLGSGQPGPTNGFWRDADWLFCRDGKWRPVEPGTFPLVDGSTFRVGSGSTFEGQSRQGMLKGYGNAVDLQATIDFIEATLETDVVDLVRGGTDAPCQSPLELYTGRKRDIEELA